MAKRVNLNGHNRLLDVGGGSGAYSLAFCAANPRLSATILDFPQTIDTAKRYAREAGLTDGSRIRRQRDNHRLAERTRCRSDVLCLERGWSGRYPGIGESAMAALPPGGLVLVHDFMVDDAREGPPFAAWYLLGGVFDNPTAVCLTPAYVEEILRKTGFEVERTEVMIPGITMLTKASKAA